MGILHSFFDESGKFQDHRIVAFCGLGASPSQLKDFDAQWFYKTPYDYYEFFKYLTRPRGSSSLKWKVAIKNKRALKKLDNRLLSRALEGGRQK
ncbi:MAG: hypothetical protein WAL32_00175 [Terriglobales bacterium]